MRTDVEKFNPINKVDRPRSAFYLNLRNHQYQLTHVTILLKFHPKILAANLNRRHPRLPTLIPTTLFFQGSL